MLGSIPAACSMAAAMSLADALIIDVVARCQFCGIFLPAPWTT